MSRCDSPKPAGHEEGAQQSSGAGEARVCCRCVAACCGHTVHAPPLAGARAKRALPADCTKGMHAQRRRQYAQKQALPACGCPGTLPLASGSLLDHPPANAPIISSICEPRPWPPPLPTSAAYCAVAAPWPPPPPPPGACAWCQWCLRRPPTPVKKPCCCTAWNMSPLEDSKISM